MSEQTVPVGNEDVTAFTVRFAVRREERVLVAGGGRLDEQAGAGGVGLDRPDFRDLRRPAAYSVDDRTAPHLPHHGGGFPTAAPGLSYGCSGLFAWQAGAPIGQVSGVRPELPGCASSADGLHTLQVIEAVVPSPRPAERAFWFRTWPQERRGTRPAHRRDRSLWRPPGLAHRPARRELAANLPGRDLRLEAFTAAGNPLHPLEGATDDRTVRPVLLLAQEFGVGAVVLVSETARSPGDTLAGRVTAAGPSQILRLLERQGTVAADYRVELAREARDRRVRPTRLHRPAATVARGRCRHGGRTEDTRCTSGARVTPSWNQVSDEGGGGRVRNDDAVGAGHDAEYWGVLPGRRPCGRR